MAIGRRLRVYIAIAAVVLLVVAAFQIARIGDAGPTGGRAQSLVKGPFVHIAFEIDYPAGAAPDRTEVGNFLAFVQQYTGKGASASYSQVSAPASPSAQEMYDFAYSVRDSHSWPVLVLSVHVVYFSGTYISQAIIGGAIDATTIVLFKSRIPAGFEDAVLAHEFSHLMGLCGIATPDTGGICDGHGHARDPQSLMAPDLETSSPWVQRLELQPAEVDLLARL